ncbi:MAG: cytidylyltransferase domain-containing protein [Chloroflexota bacterium]
MRVVAIVQARMGSTRLPGKVLLDLAGEPMLTRVMERLARAERLDEVVVATTVEPADDAIVELSRDRSWPCFRGSQRDVLDRTYRSAKAYQADAVVRVTSDCPLIDWGLVDRVVEEFLARQPQVDYASNTMPNRTFPRGLDTEVVRFDALERAWCMDDNPAWREHVTPYVRRHPELFGAYGVANDEDLSRMRWTVDAPQDLAFVRRIYEHFGHDRFSWVDVLSVLERHPEWVEINRGVKQKSL